MTIIEKLKCAWKFFRFGWNCPNGDEMLEIIGMLGNVEKADMEYTCSGDDAVNLYSTDDTLDIDFAVRSMHRLRDQLIMTLGNEGYGERLNEIEPDLAMAYKEADYQIARADFADAELQYYKAANDPNGAKAPMLKKMWDHRCEMKKKVEAFESEIQQ